MTGYVTSNTKSSSATLADPTGPQKPAPQRKADAPQQTDAGETPAKGGSPAAAGGTGQATGQAGGNHGNEGPVQAKDPAGKGDAGPGQEKRPGGGQPSKGGGAQDQGKGGGATGQGPRHDNGSGPRQGQGPGGQQGKSGGGKGQGQGQGQGGPGAGQKGKGGPAGQSGGKGQGAGQAGPEKAAEQSFKPVARPARMRRRHYGLVLSYLLVVLLPLFGIAYYLYTFAQDQYASNVGFTVRTEETGAATDLLGGLSQFTGGNTSTDADILFEFINSAELVQRLGERIDLVSHYAEPHDIDPVFGLAPDATLEDLVGHWQDVVRVSYTQSNGLIDLQVLAFEPGMAQDIARAIVEESQILINELNAQARADSMRYAQQDLEAAIDRLRAAREALTEFRTETQIVDPESDLQGRTGVLNNLQQQLAEALIELDLLTENSTNPDDPRLVQAQRRIDVIRERIRQERQNFATEDVGAEGEDYPTLMAEYEGLVVDREFAEESYRAALTALDAARTNAARQSRYLAVYIQPTLPQSAEFPRREVIVALSLLFLSLGWAIMALIYYSIRDRQ
jgi:capsular polysaccharide transport system permease protein